MEHSAKNKISITIWLLMLGLVYYLCIISKSMVEWQKVIAVVFWTLITFINLYRNSKNFNLKANILTVRQMLRKEKLYDLTTVSSWSENNYQLLGFKTGREIIINTESGLRLNLSDSNSREFEKLSEYLNGNVPTQAYENYR